MGLKKAKSTWVQLEVLFDSKGSVKHQTLTHSYRHYKHYERFTEIVIHILEKMAQEMKWYDQTQRMALTLMQHQLFGSEEIPGIEFHRDASQHTLVIMLDDSEDNLTGWDGGEFLFKLIETTLPIYRIYPQVGWGILFSNEGTRHAVTPMRLKNASCKWIERTILSLHQL